MSKARATGKRGRRPGSITSRDAILRAAARQFAERGYGRATQRSIAKEAGVDSAMVIHFFGSKRNLFGEAVQPPVDPVEILAVIGSGGRDGVGERLARFALKTFENEVARQRMVSLLRAALTEPDAAAMLREILATRLLRPMASLLGSDHAELRASLVGAQMIGLVMGRYVFRVEPFASAPPETVVAAIAPALQRYLTGPLDLADGNAHSVSKGRTRRPERSSRSR